MVWPLVAGALKGVICSIAFSMVSARTAQQRQHGAAAAVLQAGFAKCQYVWMVGKPAAYHLGQYRLAARAQALAVDDAHTLALVSGAVQEQRQLLVRFETVQAVQVQLGT